MGRADGGREDNVGVEHEGKCRIVIAHVKPHDLTFERVADLHAFEGAVHVLVGVGRAQPGFAGFPELNPNAAVLLDVEGHTLVTDGHLGWVGPGLHDPIFFPPRSRHVGAVARRTGSHPKVDAGPHVVQFEAGLRHKAFRPLRRILAFVDVHAVTRFRHGFMDRLRRRAFPSHAPAVADQIARRRGRPFEVVVPQFCVAVSGHPHVHSVRLQPRDTTRPFRTHLRRNVPLALVGEPMEAVVLGGQGRATCESQDHPHACLKAGHHHESNVRSNVKTANSALRLPSVPRQKPYDNSSLSRRISMEGAIFSWRMR